MAVFQRAAKVQGTSAALGLWLACLSACGGSAETNGASGAGGASGAAAASGATAGNSGAGASGSAGSDGSSGSGAGSGGSSGSNAGPGCQVGGCSAELCGPSGADLNSDCLWREEYVCYQNGTTRCQQQSDGRCAWTERPELTECIALARGAVPLWYKSCGSPGCDAGDAPTSAFPACSGQQEGMPCSLGAPVCDLGCGALLVCALPDPRVLAGACSM
jgi:hypothetical protein